MPDTARRPEEPESARLKRVLPALLSIWLALPAGAADAGARKDSSHPLLELARELETSRDKTPRGAPGTDNLREVAHQLQQASPPKDEECAGSIGARRYADLYLLLGSARSAEGDFVGAAAEFRRAHACRPRDPVTLAAIAGALFDARDYVGARAAINDSLAIDPRDVSANRLAGNLDYVEERWADAIARFRYVAASDPDRDQAGYGQLMFWLAQRRAGVARPELVARTPGEGWPQPLLLYMRGEYTEAELLKPIRDGDSDSNREASRLRVDDRQCLGGAIGAGRGAAAHDVGVIHPDQAGADRIGEPALLAHLVIEPRGERAAAEDVVDHIGGDEIRIVPRDAGRRRS